MHLQETPPDGASAVAVSPYLDQFAQLASPVPNLAATLSTQAEQDANDDNVSFLRTRLPTPPLQSEAREHQPLTETAMPEANTPPPLRDARSGQVIPRTDAEHRRMRRAVAATAEAAARYSQERASEVELTYADRVSQQPSQGYLGWAPGSSDDEEGSNTELRNRGEGSSQFYNEWSSRMRELREARSSRRELSQLLDQVTHTQDELDSYLRASRDSIQNRQASDFASTHLPALPQYLLDREQAAAEDAENARRRHQRNHDRATMILEQRRRQQLLSEVQQRASRVPNEDARQAYDNVIVASASVSKTLEETIKYLGRIRSCISESEQVYAAHDAGLITEEFSHDWEDFMFHRSSIKPPPITSWFQHGGVLSGSQHAPGASCLHMPYSTNRSGAGAEGGPASRRRTRLARSDEEELFLGYTHPVPGTSSRNNRSYSSLAPSASSLRANDGEERWPVKVSIHNVEYSTMTLSGTMEAFNVPDKSSPTHESSITTFLEGEIIDFNIHSLETETFNANARVDATYWRKLEPFKYFTDKEMVKNLVSKRWLNEEFSKKWILMRWKGNPYILDT